MTCPEGSGIRVRRPNANSVRAFVLAQFALNPACILTRDEIAERTHNTIKAVDAAVRILKRDGQLKPLAGPGHTVGYQSTGRLEPLPRANQAKPKREPKPERAWPQSSAFVEPRSIPNSVFDLARCAGVA